MRFSPYITTLFLIFILSVLSATLLYLYLDPERNLTVSFATMGTALTLGVASFSGICIYAFKKIYYRGLISQEILHASVRQGFLIAGSLLGLAVFYKLGILNEKTGGLLIFIVLLIELMIQSIVRE